MNDGLLHRHGGALITGAVAILVAVVTAVATTVGERQREHAEQATATQALKRDAYASVLAAAARFGNALPPTTAGADERRAARVEAAGSGVFEATALAMLVGSERAREALQRLQAAVSEAAVAFDDRRDRDDAWLFRWSRAKTDLLELARREVGPS